MDDIRGIFEIGATAVNQNDLARRIAADLEVYQLDTPENWPEFAITAVSATNATTNPPELYASLEQAARAYDNMWVAIEIKPSRWPLVNFIKRGFHQLVIFYVNRLGERQIKFNDRILRAVNLLAADQAAQNNETAALKQQIIRLQNQIDKLEKR
ncbi:hypothetical protein MNBD_CHLOROFLEXI01-4753 [hydrothermal vent metagenome]|uniref:Uncharacterized protein n=1 Tax=hydrothermal vent metagenome TaxID=652676 RepID=A0A3B0VH95_9ZZZZ